MSVQKHNLDIGIPLGGNHVDMMQRLFHMRPYLSSASPHCQSRY